MHEGILTRVNIKRRIPSIDDLCSMNEAQQESVLHCIINCSHLTDVWRLLVLQLTSRVQGHSHFANWWEEYIEALKNSTNWKEDLNRTAMAF